MNDVRLLPETRKRMLEKFNIVKPSYILSWNEIIM